MKERIIELLKQYNEALDLIQINDFLKLSTAEELNELENSINMLVDDYIIYKTKKNKYLLLEKQSFLKKGRLKVNKKGFAFLLLDNEDDLYISKENVGRGLQNDYVLCEVINKEKNEGRVLKILKRELEYVVGVIEINSEKTFVIPDDEKMDISIQIDKKDEQIKNCVEGTKVYAKIIKQLSNKSYKAQIEKIIGHKNDPRVDIISIAYNHSIFTEFPEEVIEETNNIPNEVQKNDLLERTDLTSKMIFTIDGDDTKDIDDAISLELDGDIYRLGVHIADVSNYVKENNPLDKEAFERGTSSYLADTVIPMLPHKLSNGICSLNPDTIRLTISCVMDIDKKGRIIKTDIFPSFIKSQKQMTYKKVNDILIRNIIPEGYEEYISTLKQMNELAKILRKEKVERGYLEFNSDEVKIIQDANGKAIDIKKRITEDGEELIEDFMIAANEAVATTITNMDLPFIYRIHDLPDQEKATDFTQLIKVLGYNLSGEIKSFNAITIQKILNYLRDKKEFEVLSNLLLRCMKKAEYSENNIGHFGLGSKCYTHFTSPIRRYPDLTVHRLLREYLFNKNINMETIKKNQSKLPMIAEQASQREVESVEAERDVDSMKMAEYMENHINEEYEGIISTVMNFGFFVQLDNMVEGLVHVNNLKGDYYEYIPEQLSMIGKNSKKTYRIADRIKIKVIAACKDNSTIDFEVIERDKNGNKK